MTMDFQNMSPDELKRIRDQAEEQLHERNKGRIQELRREAKELAKELGISVNEVYGVESGKYNRRKAAPKYANPDNPTQTWAGRGKRPVWLIEKLKAGHSLEEFKI